MTDQSPINGSVKGGLNILLRLEGLVVFSASLMAYTYTGYSWKTFLLFCLLPDLGLLGYVLGKRSGCITYNVCHSYILPLLLGAYAFYDASPYLQCLTLIWTAHIGFDRALGFGLKYADGFAHTHLGDIKTWSS